MKANMCIEILHTACPTKIYMLIHQSNPCKCTQSRIGLLQREMQTQEYSAEKLFTSLSPLPFNVCSERIIDFHFLSANKILG